MSKQTDFAREYLAWKESLRFQDDSPEAFEEVLRLQQLDRRVQYIQQGPYHSDYAPGILDGDFDDDIDEWFYSLDNGPVIVVTEEDIEDVPLD